MNLDRDVKLISFEVSTYKNFISSGDVEVDSEATVLVGKNEAGKSTLLDALWRLNPANDPPRGFDFVLDYPRWLKKEHEGMGTAGTVPPIAATFEMGEEACRRLSEEFGPGVVSPTFTATREYEGELAIDVEVDSVAWARSFATAHPAIWSDAAGVASLEQLTTDLEAIRQRLDVLERDEASTADGNSAEGQESRDVDVDTPALREGCQAAEGDLNYKSALHLKEDVYDRRHRATTPFTTRSTGFRWFVSFLAQFSYYAEGRKDVIVLLDEPGVSLHAKAQQDLLGYIDKELVPNQQVIYTTHSAWMVPVRRIHRVRTVEEDLEPEISSGATISGKMLAKDRDTLMPLQAALGYDVAQTLFVGPDSLVVEGISEVLYLYDLSDLLSAEGRASLDQRWHICPAGSVGRIPAMLGLLGNSVDTTVLIDSPANPTERGHIEERLYDHSRLIEIANITGAQEGDIEDLIAPADYLAAFNACFQTEYKVGDLTAQIPRLTKQLEQLHGSYNHGEVARFWVRERAAGRLAVSDSTKQCFELLFVRVNETLTAPVPAPQNPARSLLDQQLADGVITPEQHAEYVGKLG